MVDHVTREQESASAHRGGLEEIAPNVCISLIPTPSQLAMGGSKFVFSVLDAIFIKVTKMTRDVIGFSYFALWLVGW